MKRFEMRSPRPLSPWPHRAVAAASLVLVLAVAPSCRAPDAPEPVHIDAVAPTEGPVGTRVTLTGRFTARTMVTVCTVPLREVRLFADGDEVGVAPTDAPPSRRYPQLRGTIPALPPGASCPVRVASHTPTEGPDASVTFTVPRVAPSAPTVVHVTPSDAAIEVAFVAGEDGGSEIVNYAYSFDDGGTWTALSPSDVASPLRLEGLENGVRYEGRLRAVTTTHVGAPSAPWSATPFTTPPAPDLAVHAAEGATLTFEATVADDGGRPVDAWWFDAGDGAGFTRVDGAEGATARVTLRDLAYGSELTVRAQAENAAGRGAPSRPLTVAVDPPAPTVRFASLTPSTVSTGDAFGTSVAIDDELAIVGMPRPAGVDGDARVFRRAPGGAWSEARREPGSAPGDAYGTAVDVAGAWVSVGDPSEAKVVGDNGGATSFIGTSFRLGPPNSIADPGQYGADVVFGDHVVFGVSTGVDGAAPAFAYGFARNDAGPTFEAVPPLFGVATVIAVASRTDVAAEGERVALATTRPGTGSAIDVYDVTYQDSTFTVQQVGASIGAPDVDVGMRIDVDGDRLAVVAYRTGRTAEVAVHVFDPDAASWRPDAVLAAPAGAATHGFGHAIALEGDRLLVAAPDAAVAGRSAAGVVHVYERLQGRWLHTARVTQPTPRANARFGASLDVDGARAIIGAPGSDVGGTSGAGRAYVTTFEGP